MAKFCYNISKSLVGSATSGTNRPPSPFKNKADATVFGILIVLLSPLWVIAITLFLIVLVTAERCINKEESKMVFPFVGEFKEAWIFVVGGASKSMWEDVSNTWREKSNANQA